MTFKRMAQRACLALTLVAGMLPLADARELRIASGVPPMHPAHNPLYTEFKDLLPKHSDGALSASLLGTEVVSLGNMRTGVTSGLVEVGLFLPAYFPADLPEINLVGDLALLGKNPQAMGAAMTEYIVTCADCQAELKKLGIAYTSTHSTNLYHILSTKPIREVEDLQGLRLRVGGPQFSRWAESMGATPTNTPVGETFEALSQRIIDGTITSAADIVSFRLEDVIRYISTIPLGTYHSTISHAVGLDTWKSLSPENRKALALTSTLTSTRSIDRWQAVAAKAEALAAEKGIQSVEPSPALVEATRTFVEQDLAGVVASAETRHQIGHAQAKVERFRQLVGKWSRIAESLDNDSAAMAQAIQREVWDRIDFAQYGT